MNLKKKIAYKTIAMATDEVNEVAKEIEKLRLRDEPAKNVLVIQSAFKKQQDLAGKWDELISTEEGDVLRFRNDNAALKGYKVQDAFVLLQNYSTIAKGEKKMLIVEIQISRQMFRFQIQLARTGKRQIFILGDVKRYGISYQQVFDVLDSSGIDQREAARYVLEASNTLINDVSTPDWTRQYLTLLEKRTKFPIAGRTIRDVLNEIMVIGQVAEAAAPTEEYFDIWMEISDRTTGEVQTTVQQAWRDKLQETPELKATHLQPDRYDELFSLAEELRLPDTKEQAKVKVQKLLGRRSLPASVYNGLQTARVHADEKGQKANEDLLSEELKKAGLEREGRVPHADEVFRMTLKRIADTPDGIEVSWRDYFPVLFPMCQKGGTEIGRYDIVHVRKLFLPRGEEPAIT